MFYLYLYLAGAIGYLIIKFKHDNGTYNIIGCLYKEYHLKTDDFDLSEKSIRIIKPIFMIMFILAMLTISFIFWPLMLFKYIKNKEF